MTQHTLKPSQSKKPVCANFSPSAAEGSLCLDRLKRGDVGLDGRIFWKYQKSAKNGEYWMSPARYEAAMQKHRSYSRRSKGWPESKIHLPMDEVGKKISAAKKMRVKTPQHHFSRKIKNGLNRRMRYEFGNQLCPLPQDTYGCSPSHLEQHLESQFTDGMTWDNYGDWHVDHIKPISSFDLSTESERIAANHYTNLQPLWAEDNLKKSNSF